MSDFKDILQAAGPFATVLVDVSTETETGEHERQLRVRECVDALQEQGAPEGVRDAVAQALADPTEGPSPRSRYVVVGADGSVLCDEVHAMRTQGQATWAPLPDLFPVLAAAADATSLVLVSVEHTGGSVTTYDSRTLDLTDVEQFDGEEQYAQKVRSGALAHRRMQQTSEDVWRDNARELADLALSQVRAGRRLVVVAGSPESRGEVVSALESAAEVIELDRAGESSTDGGEEALLTELQTVAEQHLEERRQQLVATVQERRGQGQAIADDVPTVLDCLVRGQVETLLLDPDALREHDVDPGQHPGLPLPALDGPVRTDLLLVAAAVSTDAAVRALPHDVDGPVAALLRWDQSA
ncbi:baeRF2 domain-containing protein [Nocardioides massiliensis]|uniref:Peptide chain release factor 1 n=1 Tax=Nocardioides massiliensis TaxID=1325935 RepID=A0ABT9NUN3_9ACTN|nr:hypothetical protein [Nocardioides massiliensis]MDP9823982.1 hypothetical protein [Nocardioides massiliensis]